jgi:hypothetical protein
MAVMVLFRSTQVDPPLYDAIMQELGFDRDPPSGALIHACGFDDDGIHVVDVWETRAEFDAFLKDRLQPVFAKLKVDVAPPVVIDIHALRASPEVDRYKVALAAG